MNELRFLKFLQLNSLYIHQRYSTPSLELSSSREAIENLTSPKGLPFIHYTTTIIRFYDIRASRNRFIPYRYKCDSNPNVG